MVLSDDQLSYIQSAATTMQIIAGALVMGVISFLAVVFFVIPAKDQANPNLVIPYVAVGFACVTLPLAFLVPSFLGGHTFHADQGEAGPLVALYQTRMIIGMALLEGAAFFNIIAYLLERQGMNLGMTAVLLAAMALKFPSRGRLENWLEDESRRIADERNLRG